MTKGKVNSTKNKFMNFLRGNIPLLQQNTVEKINWSCLILIELTCTANVYTAILHLTNHFISEGSIYLILKTRPQTISLRREQQKKYNRQ